ncbi:MAG: hypothetical protein ABI561_01010 [Bradyrhizobium sp.]
MSHHKTPSRSWGKTQRKSIGKKLVYQKPGLPDMRYPTSATSPVETCFSTATGSDGAQALAKVVKSTAGAGTLFCAPGNDVSKRLGGDRKIRVINLSLTSG